MNFKPHGTLRNRSFIGLLIAQFQAAFSDQAIQASAMFYAIRLKTLPEEMAIALLPVLFFSPWAMFVTWAGYLADKYSKQYAIRFWKVFEVGIVIITFVGFFLGSVIGHDPEAAWARYLGSYMVMSTVFLMGMQSAFFVPAKYGIMPEMLQPHLLSRGNGLLESLSFLAIILGTVAGGVLIWVFGPDMGLDHHEPWLGAILIVLSLIGAGCSFMVERPAAANPGRPFPLNPFTPIIVNCKTLLRSRPLLFAVLGIAFFTFMVAYMRNTMYMHGQSRIERWSERDVSLVVGVVALGIGLGSPLAGYLSGRKVELGLVPLGGIGMIVALLVAALVLNVTAALIVCVVFIGFFTGFYIVPMFTLLQHRAPKESKGDLIATSNFINVIGAIIATVLFVVVVMASSALGIIKSVPHEEIIQGELASLVIDDQGKITDFKVTSDAGAKAEEFVYSKRKKTASPSVKTVVVEKEGFVEENADVVVIQYELDHAGPMPWSESTRVEHFRIIESNLYPVAIENRERLPRFLFLGGGVITFLILILLRRQLPDIFARCLLWIRSQGRYHLKVVGIQNLPQEEAAILATNCDTHETALQVVAVTDRSITFLLLPDPEEPKPGLQLRYLARSTNTLDVPTSGQAQADWDKLVKRGSDSVKKGHLLGLTVGTDKNAQYAERLLEQVRSSTTAPIIPVWCGTPAAGEDHVHQPLRDVRVVIGQPLRADAGIEEIRQRIKLLADWLEQTEQEGVIAATAMIPEDGAKSSQDDIAGGEKTSTE